MKTMSDLIDTKRFIKPEKPGRKPNEFYELCAFFATIYNSALEAGTKPVTPQRFMRDCKKNRNAYEQAKRDFDELIAIPTLVDKFKSPKDQARLLFGRLKNIKAGC